MMARGWHRIRQFFGALRPRVTVEERREAYNWLTESQRKLFETMMLRDQQHGVIVLRRVRQASAGDDRSLFAAALLHDCGKGRVALWQRAVHVMLAASWPSLDGRIASETGAGWRRAFWRLRYHPDIGADLAVRAGSDAEIVRLIREQDAPRADERLAMLQAADDA
jgi:hypothetical protein